jgi:uncharacterized SAM-binding protein YcdF (DUF218 family)
MAAEEAEMSLLLVKIISVLIYPAGLSFFMLAIGMGLWRWGRSQSLQTWGRRTAVGGLVVLYLFSNGLVAETLTRSLERQYLPTDPIPRADGVIVLGGGIYPRAFPRPTVEVGEAGDRILYAANLLRKGAAEWILCAAGSADLSYTTQPHGEAMQEILGWMGIKESQVILDTTSRTTRENAVHSLPLAVERGARRVLLVTSASHMPRSIRIFQKQASQLGIKDLEIIPAPCDYAYIDPEKYPPLYYRAAMGLLPTSASMETSARMLHEYFGMVYYWLRGWI